MRNRWWENGRSDTHDSNQLDFDQSTGTSTSMTITEEEEQWGGPTKARIAQVVTMQQCKQ